MTLFLALLHISLFSLAQDDEKIEIRSVDRQQIKRKDTIYRFYAIIPEHPVRTRPDRTYYWYKSDTILSTAGGYDGRLLDGSYTVFYPDNNLEEKGTFVKGLRAGEWTSWYPGGIIRSVFHWEAGLKSGQFTEYDRSGRKTREGRFKNNALSGEIKEYSADGKVHTTRYKEGIPVVAAPAKDKKKETQKKESGNEHAG